MTVGVRSQVKALNANERNTSVTMNERSAETSVKMMFHKQGTMLKVFFPFFAYFLVPFQSSFLGLGMRLPNFLFENGKN